MSLDGDSSIPPAGDESDHPQELSPSLGGKMLKSAEPDLEVVVGQGDDMRTYHHHSILLASYSDYIDTMLSTPMREQETHRITFPDISAANWEKILLMHQLNGRRGLKSFLNKDEAPVLLPLLDKYQFNDVLGACDALLAEMFGRLLHSEMTSGDLANAIAVAHVTHGLNGSCMNLARPKIAEFAVEKLEDMPTSLSSKDVEVLLLLVDDDHISSLMDFIEIANGDTGGGSVATMPMPDLEPRILSRLTQELSRSFGFSVTNETREVIREPNFADRLRIRTLQLSEQDDMVRRLIVKRLRVDAPPTLHHLNISGEYVRKESGIEGHIARHGKIAGAKKYCFVKHYTSEDGDAKKIIIEAYDLLGTAWIMTDFGQSPGRFLYFWENEFGSLIPPKYGWKEAPTSHDSPPSSIFDGFSPTLHYSIESRAW